MVESLLDREELRSIINHLDILRKTHSEWDNYRAKINSDLLNKWREVLAKCRAHGFISPRAIDGQLTWKQIISNPRTAKQNDRCTPCNKECTGKIIHSKAQRIFVPCWFGGN